MSKIAVQGFSAPEWLMKALDAAAKEKNQNRSAWIRRAVMDALMDQKIDLSEFARDEK